MPDLAVIIPTRGRPGNVARVLDAWTETGAWGVAWPVVVFDADDPQRDAYAELMTGYGGRANWVEMPRWLPMVHKLDEVARTLAGGFFALGFAGDDHLPRTGGWASRYLGELRRLETGIVYGDDGYQGAKLPTEWAMTANIVQALGRMVPAPVEHMYCDNSILDLGRAARCIRHLSDVVIEHLNPYAGKGRMDAQYKRVNSREQYRKDRASYQAWRRRELPAHAESVRSLMPGYRIKAGLQPRGEVVTAGSATDRTRQRPSTVAPWPKSNRERRAQTMVTKFNVPRRLFKIQSGSPPNVMVALADLASQVPADRAIVELGVFRGATAVMMAWGAGQGQGAHVWGIDAWDLPGNTYGPPFTDPGSRNWARYNVKAQGFASSVTLIHDFSTAAAERWPEIGEGRPVGLLFVDADHSYEGARGDVASWTPYLADDAVIAFDDYGHPDWPGVKQAVDEMVGEGILEPVQIFHDRLAVTRLGSGHPELVRREQAAGRPGEPSSMHGATAQGGQGGGPVTAITSEGVAPLPAADHPGEQREHPGTGEVGQPVDAPADGTERELTTEPETPEESARVVDDNLRSMGSAGLMPPAEGRPVEPAGKAETVPMAAAPPELAGKTGLDDDPNVAVARETVLAGEIESVTEQTTIDQLNVAQLRELAQARHITLGRDRKTRDAALAALRAGK